MPAYLKLLLKDRLLAFLPSRNQKAGKNKVKAVASLIGFALLFVILYGSLVALEYFAFQGFVMIGSPEGILAMVFLLCVVLTLVISFFYVFHALFFSKDIAFVSALPISSRGLFGAKLIMVFLGEAMISLLICLPVMVLYGLHTGADLWLYVKTLLFVPLLPVVPIAVVTLLAFLLIRVSALWKRREGVTTIATFVLVMGILAGQMSLSGFLAENASLQMVFALFIQKVNLVDIIIGWFPPIGLICNAFLMSGTRGWLYGILFALGSVGIAALFIFILGGGYQALAVKQGEAVARLNAQNKRGKRSRGQRSPFKALFLRELKHVFSVPPYASNCLAPLVMFPIMMVVMFLGFGQGQNEAFSAIMSLMQDITRPLYLAAAAAGLCLTCSMNIAVSTAVSREGKVHYFSRIIPIAVRTQLLAKLCMGLTLSGATLLISAAVLWVFLPGFWLETLVALLIAGLFAFLTCAAGLMMDALRPNFSWKSETDAVKRSTNGIIIMFGAMLLLCLLVALFFLLQSFGLSAEWNLAAIGLLMTVVDGLLLWWLLGKVSTTYCLQEKFN